MMDLTAAATLHRSLVVLVWWNRKPAQRPMPSRRFTLPDIPDPVMPEDTAEDTAKAVAVPEPKNPIEEKSPVHYQYKGQYIMTAVKSGLMIIDQHRAHVRILYERYLSQIGERKAYSQKMLFPETVQFAPADNVTLQNIMPELEAVGFELKDTGGGSYSIVSVPAGLDGLNYVSLVQDLVESARDKSASAIEEINHSLALGLARNAAVAYGQVLVNDEMENIVNDLFACTNFNYTPDGKKVLTLLRQSEMDRLFG